MSLSEFRQLPFPERLDGSPRLICTGDPLPPTRSFFLFADVTPNRLNSATGVTTCAWYRSLSGGGAITWLRTNLLAGGYPTENQQFEFVSPATGETPVLFKISMTVRSDGKSALRSGLETRFGAPTSDIPWTPDHRMSFATWKNGGDQVVLSETTHVSLTYERAILVEAVDQRKQLLRGTPASGL